MPVPFDPVVHIDFVGCNKNRIWSSPYTVSGGLYCCGTVTAERCKVTNPRDNSSIVYGLLKQSNPYMTMMVEYGSSHYTADVNLFEFINGNYNTTISITPVNGETHIKFAGNLVVDDQFFLFKYTDGYPRQFANIAIVIDGNGMHTYLDGVFVKTVSFLETVTRDYDVGIYRNDISQYDGEMSDIYIWDKALTASEIVDAYDYSKNVVIGEYFRCYTLTELPLMGEDGDYHWSVKEGCYGKYTLGSYIKTPDYFEFDGSEAYVATTARLIYGESVPLYEMDIWFYPFEKDVRVGVLGAYKALHLSINEDNTAHFITSISMYSDADGNYYKRIIEFDTDQQVRQNQWNLLHIRIDTTSTLQAWFNGLWQSTNEDISEFAGQWLTYSDTMLTLGKSQLYYFDAGGYELSTDSYFKGRLKKFRFYKSARKMSDVLSEWREEYPPDLYATFDAGFTVTSKLSTAPATLLPYTVLSIDTLITQKQTINALLRSRYTITSSMFSRVLKETGKDTIVESINGVAVDGIMRIDSLQDISPVYSSVEETLSNNEVVYMNRVKGKFSIYTSPDSFVSKQFAEFLIDLISSDTNPLLIILSDGLGIRCRLDIETGHTISEVFEGSGLYNVTLSMIEV